jgi:hypothetical protein
LNSHVARRILESNEEERMPDERVESQSSRVDVEPEDLEVSTEDAESVKGGTDAVVTPRDPATGLPTGKRMHKPFTVG